MIIFVTLMTLFLTGSPCRKGEDHFTEEEGFLSAVREALAAACGERHRRLPRILLVSAAPDDPQYNRDVFESMRACIDRSGIGYSSIKMLKRGNSSRAGELVPDADLIFFCGGHVPTQNAFLHDLGMKSLMAGFKGVVIGCSAGSMNCAENVYSHPELPGESVNPKYSRSLKGLGLTDVNLVPHLEDIRDAVLDGRRLVDEIVVQDSWGHRFYLIPDGAYVLCKDGRQTLHGEAYLIENGTIRQISARGGTHSLMNVVFTSPHFPQTYGHFCAMLRRNGVNVFGIGDTPYDNLTQELRDALVEYYRVDSMEDYDQMYRAVAFLAFKHGKIDWIESNNEYWLEQDARLRTDFNVVTGVQLSGIGDFKEKSAMKKFYALGGIPTARQIKASEGLEKVQAFVGKTGWPIIAKPDNGVGAEGTFKMNCEEDLVQFFREHESNHGLFVIEEFITGSIVSYDAVIDSNSEPVFESESFFPVPIMNIVKDQLDINYWVEKKIDPRLAELGRRTVKAFGVKSRFVHMEFFKLDRAHEGLGEKGDYVGLEVNMRPAGGYTPDMMNYAHSTDVFKIWADMVAFDECRTPQGEQNYCAYAGRRDSHSYVHSHEEVLDRFKGHFCMVERMPKALSSALCDMAYLANFPTKKEMQEFFSFVGLQN